jgi:hypothetical protein
MKHISLLILSAALLSACGTAPTTSITMKGNEVPIVKKRHDAKPGQFEKFTYPLQAGTELPSRALRAVISAEKLRNTAEWRSTIVFCVDTKRSGAATCLSIAASADGKTFAGTVVQQAATAAPVDNQPLAFALAADVSHTLDFVFHGATMQMMVDSKPVLSTALKSVPDEYWFSCSSVVCAVDVYHPLPGAVNR